MTNIMTETQFETMEEVEDVKEIMDRADDETRQTVDILGRTEIPGSNYGIQSRLEKPKWSLFWNCDVLR